MSNLGNILIVDDSKDLLEAFQHFLTLAGYTVNSVNTSRLLEEIINKFKPDVILLDVLMPGRGGRKCVRN